MGEFASVIVARATDFPLAAKSYRDEPRFVDEELSGGWHIWAFENDEFAWEAHDAIRAIQHETDAPSLVGQIVDSDYLILSGITGGHAWDVVLPSPRDPDLERVGLTGEAAVGQLLEWAESAGLVPVPSLAAQLPHDKGEGFSGWSALELLRVAVGLKT